MDHDGIELLKAIRKRIYNSTYRSKAKLHNASDEEVTAFINSDEKTLLDEEPIYGFLNEKSNNDILVDVNADATTSDVAAFAEAYDTNNHDIANAIIETCDVMLRCLMFWEAKL